MSTSSSAESASSPEVVSESRGSSVSTGLREEYEDLLRYAVVTPVLNASTSKVLTNQSRNGGPPPRSSPPPRPHTPPRHSSRSEAKAKGILILNIYHYQKESMDNSAVYLKI